MKIWHPSQPSVENQPTKPSIKCVRLYKPTLPATIATLLSGSTNGYIGHVWTAAAYDIIAPGMPFNCSVALNAKPDLPARANQMLVGTLIHTHEESKHIFIKCTNIVKVLKLLVKQAVKLPYFIGICNHTTGTFPNVSLLCMLYHFFTTYRTITSTMNSIRPSTLSRNRREPLKPSLLISTRESIVNTALLARMLIQMAIVTLIVILSPRITPVWHAITSVPIIKMTPLMKLMENQNDEGSQW